MRKIKLIIWFDGSCYHGYQVQTNAITVQQTLEEAVRRVTGKRETVVGCGRTDAGVHALAYVCHFTTDSTLPCNTLVRALNANLPDDVVVRSASEASEHFHAQKSAVKKTYRYVIWNAPEQNPFLLRYACHIKPTLCVEDMQQAAQHFVGRHDFIGFASSGFTVKTTVRTIYEIKIARRGGRITVDITADGFLYNMARILTGTLIDVGLGKIAPEEIPDILRSRDRRRAGATARPEGLFLKQVFYRRFPAGRADAEKREG